MKYFFRGTDFKANSWKAASKEKKIILISGSRIIFTFLFIKRTLFQDKQKFTLILRYLNDYKSPAKSALLFLSELILFFYIKLKGVRLYWISHNIDKESQDYFPILTKVRRLLVLSASTKIFVLDEILVKYAKLLFKKHAHKIYSTNFGPYLEELSIHQSTNLERVVDHQKLFFKGISEEELLDIIKKESSKFDYLGFCAGKAIKKKVHFKEVPKLVSTGKTTSIDVLMIVISDITESKEPILYNYFKDSKNVIFVNSIMEINAYKLSELIDFYWLGYSDISIPYSIYVAASVKKPVISMTHGILPIILKEYNIGEVVHHDYKNIKSILQAIKSKKYDFDGFLANHTWEQGIQKLLVQNQK